MEKSTLNFKKSTLKSVGSFFAAGMLLFGAASCGGGETREDVAETDVAYGEESLEPEIMQENEQVANTDADLFGQYDKNTDQRWDRDEFNTSMGESGMYGEWDADRDGFLNENEYNEGTKSWQNESARTFSDWDMDRNGNLNEDEFNEGTFGTWDTDRDGMLSSDEYNMGMGTGTTTEEGL